MQNFTPISALVGGSLIGLSASLVLFTHGRIAGISGMCSDVLKRGTTDRPFRLAFLGGLTAGGVLMRLAAPSVFASSWSASLPVVLVAGVIVGLGTQLGNGCTSGHGVCGVARLSPRSIVATVTFLLTAIATVFVLRHLFGGSR